MLLLQYPLFHGIIVRKNNLLFVTLNHNIIFKVFLQGLNELLQTDGKNLHSIDNYAYINGTNCPVSLLVYRAYILFDSYDEDKSMRESEDDLYYE